MTASISIYFLNVAALIAGLVIAGAAALAATRRKPAIPGLAQGLIALGLIPIALAAGGLTWRRLAAHPVAVYVDLSPSTRTASYRDPDALRNRVIELLGDVPYRLVYFAGQSGAVPDGANPLPDLPAERTVFTPEDAPAVLLFSDGRFELPAFAPRTFAVIDPALDTTTDASVVAIEPRGRELAVTVRNGGAAERVLVWSGVDGDAREAVATGTYVLTRSLAAGATSVAARLSPGDAWPENDALSAPVPPAGASRPRWWVGRAADAPPDGGWTVLAPAELPADPAAYLAPSAIVLGNVAAADLGDAPQRRLRQYVRDLGGGLLILGGGRAFGAGGYTGTPLDALSPLASAPPEPAAHWMLLADASGSMAAPADDGSGKSRWRYAAEALTGLLPRLPPEDRVSVGSFATGLNWWVHDAPARDAAILPLPPADAAPRGPTNLRPALEQVAAAADATPQPKHLLLVTDANADLGDVNALATALRQKHVRLHLLDIGGGTGTALPALRQLAEATGGTVRAEALPRNWAEGIRELMRTALPDPMGREPVEARFVGELSALPALHLPTWNRTWVKQDATPLAEGQPAGAGRPVPLAAQWALGEGKVIAAAFGPDARTTEALARLAARPPRDPRLNVSWKTGPTLRVTIDATDGASYLNGLKPTLEWTELDGSGTAPVLRPIPQTAPGRYALSIDAPRRPGFAAVRLGGRTLDRVAVAGRYAPEFDALGNDRDALRALAARTGGAVVEPSRHARLDLHPPRRDLPLAPWLASAGALCVALGLVRWRMGT